MFNFENEILQAVENLKERTNLVGDNKKIALAISNWLEDQLEDIDWQYQNSSYFRKFIDRVDEAE